MHLQPFLHATPSEALGKLIHQSVRIGDKTFEIDYPGDVDRLLDHPSTHSAFQADEYMPYWAELWPSAQMLGEALLQQDWAEVRGLDNNWPTGYTALEIGCGVGLSGIVALALGMRVIFSDYDATAVEFAARNAVGNGFENFETLPLDWRFPPDWQVPLILAADVIYEERNIAPLVAFIQAVLAPGGMCLISDPDRSTRGGFVYALKQAKLKVKRQAIAVCDPNNRSNSRQITGTIYCIQH